MMILGEKESEVIKKRATAETGVVLCHPRCQENLPSADHQHQYQLIQMCLPSCQEKGDVSRCVCNAIQMVIIL